MASSQSFKINRPNVISESIDGETIVINMKSGIYFSLNKIGGDIWDLIDANLSLEKIINRINCLYAGKKEEIISGIEKFIGELNKHDLISTQKDRINIEQIQLEENYFSENILPIFEIPKLEIYEDMQELLLLDPIHDVDETGWPKAKE